MPAPRFDSVALFRALDDARRDRAMSWQQLAAEAGVAASTMQRARLRRPMEADGVLAMVRVVERVPEDFAFGIVVPGGSLGRGRLNTQALHAALDAKRRHEELSWAELARHVGCDAGTLQRLAKGGRTNADLMLACAWWLERQVADFVDPDFEHPGEARQRAQASGG